MDIKAVMEEYTERVRKKLFYPESNDYYKEDFIFDNSQPKEVNRQRVLKENKRLDEIRENVRVYEEENEIWFQENYIQCLLDNYNINLKQAIAIFDYLNEKYSYEFKENTFYFEFAGELADKIINAENEITFIKQLEEEE